MAEPRVVRGPGPTKPLGVLDADGDVIELRGRGSNRELPVYLTPLFDVLERIAETLDDLLEATRDITNK